MAAEHTEKQLAELRQQFADARREDAEERESRAAEEAARAEVAERASAEQQRQLHEMMEKLTQFMSGGLAQAAPVGGPGQAQAAPAGAPGQAQAAPVRGHGQAQAAPVSGRTQAASAEGGEVVNPASSSPQHLHAEAESFIPDEVDPRGGQSIESGQDRDLSLNGESAMRQASRRSAYPSMKIPLPILKDRNKWLEFQSQVEVYAKYYHFDTVLESDPDYDV